MIQKNKHLERQGWIRQFIADGPLAKDAVEIYDLLGFHVHLQPLNHKRSKKRGSSVKEIQSRYKMVYIRPKKSLNGDGEGWI